MEWNGGYLFAWNRKANIRRTGISSLFAYIFFVEKRYIHRIKGLYFSQSVILHYILFSLFFLSLHPFSFVIWWIGYLLHPKWQLIVKTRLYVDKRFNTQMYRWTYEKIIINPILIPTSPLLTDTKKKHRNIFTPDVFHLNRLLIYFLNTQHFIILLFLPPNYNLCWGLRRRNENKHPKRTPWCILNPNDKSFPTSCWTTFRTMKEIFVRILIDWQFQHFWHWLLPLWSPPPPHRNYRIPFLLHFIRWNLSFECIFLRTNKLLI